MAWTQPKFKPGLNSRDTGLANEAGMADCNHIRIRDGMPQTGGGWAAHSITPTTFDGTARADHAWRTLEGKPVMAWGTNTKLYAEYAGAQRDITPNLHQTVLSSAFWYTSGTRTIRVYMPFHGLVDQQNVTFANVQGTFNGIAANLINGTRTITLISDSEFSFLAANPASATTTSTTWEGPTFDFVAELAAGLASSTSTTELRQWSLHNWGEFLLANPSGGGIYEYQPAATYPNLAYNGDFTTNADGWALGSLWSWNSSAIRRTTGTGTATGGSNASQNVEGAMIGGKYYTVTFTVGFPTGAGTTGVRFRMNAGSPAAVIDVGVASTEITVAGTYTRMFLCPADPKDIVFEARSTTGTASVVTIDTVSYSLFDKAYRITTAPPRVDAMFVDINGLVVALGTTTTDGVYSATAYRCSDLGNNRSWVPDVASYATEGVIQGAGGRLMAGLSTRQQNLVWGDEGVLSLKFQKVIADAFDINLLGSNCGIISRHAMIEDNGFVLWMTNNGQFRFFEGVGATSLGVPKVLKCPIQEDIFNNRVKLQDLKIHAGANSRFSEAWFFVPDTRDGTDECSRAYVVSWTEGDEFGNVPWVKHSMARTAWQKEGIFPNPIAFAPASSTTGRIYDHEVGYTADGAALNEYLLTSPFNIGEGEYLALIRQMRPHFSNQTGNVQFDFTGRMSPNGSDFTLPDTLTATPTTTELWFRFKARQISMKLTGKTTGGFWRWGAITLDVEQTGAKR
jgi:hypothetical protein